MSLFYWSLHSLLTFHLHNQEDIVPAAAIAVETNGKESKDVSKLELEVQVSFRSKFFQIETRSSIFLFSCLHTFSNRKGQTNVTIT